MRILHTSDWHLGQHFMGRTRQAEHAALIDWLVQQVQVHQVDAVILAGDVFDTTAPPSYARELYNTLVLRLHDVRCQLVVLAGNHDSVATLQESSGLLQRLGTQVVAAVHTQDLCSQILTLHNRHGKPAALLCAVPFVRPRDVLRSQADESADDKRQNLQQAIAAHYQQLYDMAYGLACQLAGDGTRGSARTTQVTRPDAPVQRLPIIATGHLTMVGARSSESVRDIYIGTLEAFPAAALPPFDYVALGHIHRPQRVGGQEHIRYCGAPLALGFDEAGQARQVLLVDVETGADHGTNNNTGGGANGSTGHNTEHCIEGGQMPANQPLPVRVQVQALAVPVFQPMASVSGTLDELQQRLPAAVEQARALAQQPLSLTSATGPQPSASAAPRTGDGAGAGGEAGQSGASAVSAASETSGTPAPADPPGCANIPTAVPVWLEVVVQDDAWLSDVQPRIQALTAGLAVDILRIRRLRPATSPQLTAAQPQQTLDDLNPHDVFARRLASEAGLDAVAQEQLWLRYRQTLQQVQAVPVNPAVAGDLVLASPAHQTHQANQTHQAHPAHCGDSVPADSTAPASATVPAVPAVPTTGQEQP